MSDDAVNNLFSLLTRVFQQRNVKAVEQVAGQLLDHPESKSIEKLYAATLRGELYRESERYEEAEKSYRLGIREGDQTEERSSIYYRLYHPRAFLGLITVLRRQLAPDTDEIDRLCADYRDTFSERDGFTAEPDSQAQIDAVEGVYRRQTGDFPVAHARLEAASRAINPLRLSWYLFWHPEHVEAHRALAYVTAPGFASKARFLADQLLERPDTDAWSRAVARVARLHTRFDDLLYQSGGDCETVRTNLFDRQNGPSKDLNELVEEGAASGNPTLASEPLMLRAAWHAAAGDGASAHRAFAELASRLKSRADPNLEFLRGVEVAAIRLTWPVIDSIHADELCGNGSEVFDFVAKHLESYNYSSGDLDFCRTLLAGEGGVVSATPGEAAYLAEPLIRLRARLWP